MSSWQQRCDYLVSVAQAHLRGHVLFDLCRAHLVDISQISRGTVYNHFPHESDLAVAVAAAEFNDFWQHAQQVSCYGDNPLFHYLYHYCWRLQEVTARQRFVISRVMPNGDLLAQASSRYRQSFNEAYARYQQWNRQQIRRMGEIKGFDRWALVRDFIRGTMINVSEEAVDGEDVQLYYQYCYALSQLLGQSDKRVPDKKLLARWLQQLSPAPAVKASQTRFALEQVPA
ncbi:TetR/AcrR family transcriptional regulator [Shewanella sp. YIC-542]|uniref:TetR/AcrR family transcriptional regulator n=1 Tax=Shewanella mytili TaxID=3377111 RepID=UPI00398F6D82